MKIQIGQTEFTPPFSVDGQNHLIDAEGRPLTDPPTVEFWRVVADALNSRAEAIRIKRILKQKKERADTILKLSFDGYNRGYSDAINNLLEEIGE